MTRQDLRVVGQRVEKVDGLGLACGVAEFTDDQEFKGLLYGRILWSPHAHAIIKSIDISKAQALEGVAVVLTHENVPRVMHTTAGQGYPEPSPYDTTMLDYKVRFVGDRVAAVAAVTPEIAERALKLIEVEYDILPAVFDPEEALLEGAPVIHDEEDARVIIPVPYDPKRNLAAHVDMVVGDMDKGMEEAEVVAKGTFDAHCAQHCPMEPHVVIVSFDHQGRLMIRTSTQVPFHVRRIVAERLELPVKKLRVIKPRIGGGFGAKQEVLIEDICAMLAIRANRPVKIEYSRKEEFISSRTRHAARTWMTVGAKRDGTLTALRMHVLSNTGAYGSHALTVVCNCGSKCLPLYHCDNVEFDGRSAYTNLPVAGAYRGYGATQAAFALEVCMDEVALEIGMDPLELRRRNHIRTGEGSPVFQALGEGKAGVEQRIGSCGLGRCLDLGAEAIGWSSRADLPRTGRVRQGMGMACLMQGSSIPHVDMGAATIKINDDGSFNLAVGATDIGTGSDTILGQIAAEVLGVRADDIIVVSSDTDITPFDVGAYASSTTYLSGNAVRKTALKVRRQILAVAADALGLDPATLTLRDGKVVGQGKEITLERLAKRSLYEKDMFQIGATASHVSQKSPPPFSASFGHVEVDMETGMVRVLKYVAVVDCGQAINPTMAEGQVQGAVVNGLSYALTERYIFDDKGRMVNPDFNHYKIFNTRDLPELVTILVPTVERTGPFGAKSVSEIGINGPLPVLSNAIFDAVGVRLRAGPFTPERVRCALKEREEAQRMEVEVDLKDLA